MECNKRKLRGKFEKSLDGSMKFICQYNKIIRLALEDENTQNKCGRISSYYKSLATLSGYNKQCQKQNKLSLCSKGCILESFSEDIKANFKVIKNNQQFLAIEHLKPHCQKPQTTPFVFNTNKEVRKAETNCNKT